MSSLTAPLQRLEGLVSRRPGRILIALAGVPGSGKSTFAANLQEAAALHPGLPELTCLGMDGFHYTRAHLATLPDPEAARLRRGAPWTFDAAGLAARLEALREGYQRTSVPWPRFRHGVGDPEEGPAVPPNSRLILVEGLYLMLDTDGWEQVTCQFHEHWFLDTPLELALERVTQRHMASWNLTREEAEARVQRNDRHNAQIVLATVSKAAFVVGSSEN